MILLIGNKLSNRGLNPTSIEKLEENLSFNYSIRSASDKQSSFIRIIEMLYLVFLYRKTCRLIIVDVFGTKAFYFSCLIIVYSKLKNIPVLPVFRGGSLPERYNKNTKLFKYIFNKTILVICPSPFLSDFFSSRKIKTQIIHNYIDIKKYPFKYRERIKPKLLWVRSIHSIYNPVMAIYVLKKILEYYPQARLSMVGPIKDNTIELIDKLIFKWNLQEKVTLTGKLEKKEWIELSKDFDIFLNTTNIDNQPVSVIEAMALGLPIVSTNVGGIPNLLTHNKTAKLVEINDVNGMVDCIKEYLSDNIGRIEIVKNARELVESEFNQDKVIPQWVDIIEKYTLPSNLSK